jgi:hypothetical protein
MVLKVFNWDVSCIVNSSLKHEQCSVRLLRLDLALIHRGCSSQAGEAYLTRDQPREHHLHSSSLFRPSSPLSLDHLLPLFHYLHQSLAPKKLAGCRSTLSKRACSFFSC